MKHYCEAIGSDVAAASASCLINALPSIMMLSASEAFDQLRAYFETALSAYFEARENWGFPVAIADDACGPVHEHLPKTASGMP